MHSLEILTQLKSHVNHFKEWLRENYSQERIDQELYDDTGYPDWNEVENSFEIAFRELNFEKLNEEELEIIGFLIARQWDVGIIFPFFREEISQIGMTENQLLILSRYAVNSREWSLRQQCAAAVWKARTNRKEAIRIALLYFQDNDSDIRRHALNSLFKMKYEHLSELVDKSWKFNDELERILCLHIMENIDEQKFLDRLSEVETDDREYMIKYITEVKIKKNIQH